MLVFAELPRFRVMNVLRKAYQWVRIGLAARKLKNVNPEKREHAQKALAAAMGEARGLAMKIGQFMAGVDESQSPYHDLVVNVNPLPLKAILPELEKSQKRPAKQLFKSIEESSAAASLGQVHKARLPDGTEVAVKIRYPGIVDAIKAELAISNSLPSGGPAKRWQVNTADYKNVLQRQLLRETDYLLEMQTQARCKQNLRVEGLAVPDVYPEYTTDAVLVQSWETGCRLQEASTWPKKDRLEIGRTLLMALFQSLFVNGEVHGDPHPGNYLFRHDNAGNAQTVLLDFGCTILVKKQSRLALLKLIDAWRESNKTNACDPFRCFVAMGFNAEKLGHIRNELPQLCDTLLRPFIEDRPFQASQWRIGENLKALLGEKRWWFRTAGPADLFMLLRAFHGLSQQLEKLEVALPWWPLLHNVVGEQLLQSARIMELPMIDSSLHPGLSKFDTAKKLCVRLDENNEERVSVILPAEAAYDLETIIPGQTLLMLLANNEVNLTELGQRLRKQGLHPQQLFDFWSGTKHCRIWLE